MKFKIRLDWKLWVVLFLILALIAWKFADIGNHSLSLTEGAWIVMLVVMIGTYQLSSYMEYYSSKIIPYENNLFDDRPITRCPEYYTEGLIWWTYGGTDIIPTTNFNKVFVARKNAVEAVDNNFLLLGILREVTPAYLFEYIGFNKRLLHRILQNYDEVNTKIYIPFIPPKPDIAFRKTHSLKGNYGIQADTFDITIKTLFERKVSQDIVGADMKKEKASSLDFITKTTSSVSSISKGVQKIRNSRIDPGTDTRPRRYDREEEDNEQNQ